MTHDIDSNVHRHHRHRHHRHQRHSFASHLVDSPDTSASARCTCSHVCGSAARPPRLVERVMHEDERVGGTGERLADEPGGHELPRYREVEIEDIGEEGGQVAEEGGWRLADQEYQKVLAEPPVEGRPMGSAVPSGASSCSTRTVGGATLGSGGSSPEEDRHLGLELKVLLVHEVEALEDESE